MVTFANNSGLARETLLTSSGNLKSAQVNRETLLSGEAEIRVVLVVREILRGGSVDVGANLSAVFRETLIGVSGAPTVENAGFVSILW